MMIRFPLSYLPNGISWYDRSIAVPVSTGMTEINVPCKWQRRIGSGHYSAYASIHLPETVNYVQSLPADFGLPAMGFDGQILSPDTQVPYQKWYRGDGQIWFWRDLGGTQAVCTAKVRLYSTSAWIYNIQAWPSWINQREPWYGVDVGINEYDLINIESAHIPATTAPSVSDLISNAKRLIGAVQPSETVRRIQYRALVNVNAPEEHTLMALLNSSIQSCMRFEEVGLVQGSPIWVGSYEPFLVGKAKAYSSALDTMPVASKNNLKNIACALTGLWSWVDAPKRTANYMAKLTANQPKWNLARIGDKQVEIDLPSVPEGYRNLWFSGRYVWTTGIMDLGSSYEYFWDYAQKALHTIPDRHSLHGTATVDGVTFRCSLLLKEKGLHGAAAALNTCYRLGLEPNLYVLWDLIPYSFVVDWFLPIGDALDAYEQAAHYSPLYYEYESFGYDNARRQDCKIQYSLSYQASGGILENVQIYCRWYESAPPNVEVAYSMIEPYHAKPKTQVFRVIDGIALICR